MDRTRIKLIPINVQHRVFLPFSALYLLRAERGDRRGYYPVDTPDIPFGFLIRNYKVEDPSETNADLLVNVAITDITPVQILKVISAFAYTSNEQTKPTLRVYAKQRTTKVRVDDIDFWAYYCKATGETYRPMT